jgi:putative addiction module component (TIGR02574 family)
MNDLGIDKLPPQQRLALALEIWASLGGDLLTEAQRAELASRDAQLDAEPAIALTWQQIRAAVEGGQ